MYSKIRYYIRYLVNNWGPDPQMELHCIVCYSSIYDLWLPPLASSNVLWKKLDAQMTDLKAFRRFEPHKIR
jgi:hypothetical protein